MSVSSELLCSFELLKPLDSNALKNHIKKARNRRNQMLNSPVCSQRSLCVLRLAQLTSFFVACKCVSPECVTGYLNLYSMLLDIAIRMSTCCSCSKQPRLLAWEAFYET